MQTQESNIESSITRRTVFKKEYHYFIGNVATSLLGFLNVLLLSRILKPYEMGQYSLFISVVFFAAMVGTTWINETYVKYAKDELLQRKVIHISHSVRMMYFLIGSVLMILLLIAFRKEVAKFINLEVTVIWVIISVFLLQSLLVWQQAYFRVIGKVRKSAYLIALSRILFFSFLLFMLFAKKSSIEEVLVYFFLSHLLVVILALGEFKVILNRLHLPKYEHTEQFGRHAFPFFIGGCCLYIVSYIDVALLNIFTTKSTVGIYAVMYSVFNAVVLLIMSMNSVFLNRILEFKKERLGNKPNWYFKICVKLGLVIFLALAFLILAIDYAVIFLLDEEYLAGTTSLKILFISVFFYFVSAASMPLFTAYDATKYFFYVSAIRAVANFVFDIVFIPIYGMAGAALGTLVSFIFAAVVAVFCVKKINYEK